MDKRLVTYLESEAFKFQLNEFFEVFNHRGICGSEKFSFHSEVFEEFNNIEWQSNLEKRLTNDLLKLFFEKKHYKSDRQLFAVILGYAFNLSYNQILRIGDRKASMRSWKVLNYFLCHRAEQTYKSKNLLNCTDITYFITIKGKKYKATFRNEYGFYNSPCLQIKDKGLVLEIL